jgi:hypothetical protein
VKWVNDHRYDGARLSPEQNALREFYGRLINLVGEPAFRDGKFFPLNSANRENERFGRLPGEEVSGHWLYAFLRYDCVKEQRFLVVANLHPTIAFQDVRVSLPKSALQFLGMGNDSTGLSLVERLFGEVAPIDLTTGEARDAGIPIGDFPALSAFYFELVDRALPAR